MFLIICCKSESIDCHNPLQQRKTAMTQLVHHIIQRNMRNSSASLDSCTAADLIIFELSSASSLSCSAVLALQTICGQS